MNEMQHSHTVKSLLVMQSNGQAAKTVGQKFWQQARLRLQHVGSDHLLDCTYSAAAEGEICSDSQIRLLFQKQGMISPL